MTHHTVRDDWKLLPWKKFRKVVFRLQKRIFKARKNGNHKLVKQLQKLLLNSKANSYLAVRQVTQINQGKATAGVDGKVALNPKERIELATQLIKGWKQWEHKELRRVNIPKKDGTKRKLGIPTIGDRAYQCLLRNTLEPAAEATFHKNSYGFRPGRGCHDAQRRVFDCLNAAKKGYQKTVLEVDIEKCFDRISHQTILEKVELPKAAIKGLKRAIKAGVRGEFPSAIAGTPQGGVISPLLANIALNGVEKIGERRTRDKSENHRAICLRYADDMVFIIRPEVKCEDIKDELTGFLQVRGLNIKESKTKVVRPQSGFDFLGWNFAVKPNGKFISTPSKDATKRVKAKVKETMKDSKYTLDQRIEKCGSIVRGWRNYNQHCDMTGYGLWSLQYWTWKFIRKQGRYNRESTNSVINKAFPKVPWKACGYVNVEGEKSVYDGDLTYWAKRENKRYSGVTASLMKQQNHKCKACGLSFLSGDKVELHHIDGNHANWKKSNLEALHRECHQHKPIHREARVARTRAKARK